MIKELVDSLKLSLFERTTSPLFGSFIGFWLVFNWQPVYYILFDEEKSVEPKLKFVFDPNNGFIGQDLNLWYPLVCAISFVLIYPIVSAATYRAWVFGNKLKNDFYQQMYKDQLLSKEESEKILNDNNELRTKVNEVEERWEAKRRTYKDRVDQAEDRLDVMSKEFAKIERERDEFETKLKEEQEDRSSLNADAKELIRKQKDLQEQLEESNYQQSKLKEEGEKALFQVYKDIVHDNRIVPDISKQPLVKAYFLKAIQLENEDDNLMVTASRFNELYKEYFGESDELDANNLLGGLRDRAIRDDKG